LAACVGCVATELVVTGCLVASVRGRFAPRVWAGAWFGVFVAAVASVTVGLLTLRMSVAVRLPLIAATFLIGAVCARAIRPEDWTTLRRLLRFRAGRSLEAT